MGLNLGLSGLAFNGATSAVSQARPTGELFARMDRGRVFYPFCRNHNAINMPTRSRGVPGRRSSGSRATRCACATGFYPTPSSLFEESPGPTLRWPGPWWSSSPPTEGGEPLRPVHVGAVASVAPVVEKGRTSRNVYLPEGGWCDFSPARIRGREGDPGRGPSGQTAAIRPAGAIIRGPSDESFVEKPWTRSRSWSPGTPVVVLAVRGRFESMDYLKGNYSRRVIAVRPIRGRDQDRGVRAGGPLCPGRRTSSSASSARPRLQGGAGRGRGVKPLPRGFVKESGRVARRSPGRRTAPPYQDNRIGQPRRDRTEGVRMLGCPNG